MSYSRPAYDLPWGLALFAAPSLVARYPLFPSFGGIGGRCRLNDDYFGILVWRQSFQSTQGSFLPLLFRYLRSLLDGLNIGNIRAKSIQIILQYVHIIRKIDKPAFSFFGWSSKTKLLASFRPRGFGTRCGYLGDQCQNTLGSSFVHVRDAQDNDTAPPEVVLIPVSVPSLVMLWAVNLYRATKRRVPEIKDTIPPQALPIPSRPELLELGVHPRLSPRMATALPILLLPHTQVGSLLLIDRPVELSHDLERLKYSSIARRITSDILIPSASAFVRKAAIWISDKYKFMRCIYRQYTPLAQLKSIAYGQPLCLGIQPMLRWMLRYRDRSFVACSELLAWASAIGSLLASQAVNRMATTPHKTKIGVLIPRISAYHPYSEQRTFTESIKRAA